MKILSSVKVHTETGPGRPRGGVQVDGGWWSTPRPGHFTGAERTPRPVRKGTEVFTPT